MSDQGQSLVLQAHAALHVTLKFGSIRRRVKTARDQLTMQQLDTTDVPESLSDLIEWCKKHDFNDALRRHNDPEDSYCIPLYTAFVIGFDIKPERQLIQSTSQISGSSSMLSAPSRQDGLCNSTGTPPSGSAAVLKQPVAADWFQT